MKPELIVMCGVSHAGKTTFANTLNFHDDYKIINTDNIRVKLHGDRNINKLDEGKVWAHFTYERNKAIENKESIILDACHLSPQARWWAKQNSNKHRLIIVVLQPDIDELIKRWKKEMRIEFEIIKSMWRNFVINKEILQSEGYKNIEIIK